MQICIFEDEEYYKFEPLIFSRPVFDLKVGISTIREKIAGLLNINSYSVLCREYLQNTLDYQSDNILINKLIDDDYLFINGRIFPDKNISSIISLNFNNDLVFKNGDVILAIYLSKESVKRIFDVDKPVFDKEKLLQLPSHNIELEYFTYLWELLNKNEYFLNQDFNTIKDTKIVRQFNQSVYLINEKSIYISDSAKLGYNIVLDASKGAIIIFNDAEIMHNCVIYGPCYIGNNSLVKSNSTIYGGTTIGNFCKVAGEISNSIFMDYANKQHDGFLGNSYLGSWVNLGAGTIISNLKNNYSKIQVELSFGKVQTDLQFLGLLMGDHSKSAIGTRFNTSSVVGFSCNIFGEGLTEKFIPSFAWGSLNNKNIYAIEKAIEVAKIVYSRRNKIFKDSDEKLFKHIFNQTTLIRDRYGYK
jgi:UDP-N-acetylglucosamine diphosphorylase/glucosamine-1-phosphate N-acetyltransferase